MNSVDGPSMMQLCVQYLAALDPNLLFEDALSAIRYDGWTKIPFGRTQQLMVFSRKRRQSSKKPKSSTTYEPPLAMLIRNPGGLTVVIHDLYNHNLAGFFEKLKTVKLALRAA